MSHRIITECPACTSRFQVTQGQLKIANGKVRCGSCLEVFNAEVYRCDDLPDPKEAVLKELQEEEALENETDSDPDPLFDDIEVPDFAAPDFSGSTPDKRYVDPDADADEKLAAQINSMLSSPDSEDDLEQPVQELLNEPLSSEPEPDSLQDDLSSLSPELQATPAKETEPEPEPEPEAELPVEIALSEEKPPETTAEEVSASQPFTRYQAEPIYIKTTREKPHHRSLWLSVSLIALLLFTAQYLWFNRQLMNSYPELAPLYSVACQHLPCNLAVPVNLQKITTNSLVITEHKDLQGALTVNLLLENHANYTQPYPAILLSFSDRNGNQIGERLLQPDEYLQESSLDPLKMPAGRIIQIHFDILDPGRRAVSYEVKLMLPASPSDKHKQIYG